MTIFLQIKNKRVLVHILVVLGVFFFFFSMYVHACIIWEQRRRIGGCVGGEVKRTLIFLLKFLLFLFFMYLWIFSLLCSAESLPSLLKVGSSKLEISEVIGVEQAATAPSCWLSLLRTCWKNHKQN